MQDIIILNCKYERLEDNIILGHRYIILGKRNIVIGNNNEIKGNNNKIKGNNNKITGSNNCIMADNLDLHIENSTLIGNKTTMEYKIEYITSTRFLLQNNLEELHLYILVAEYI